jgi:subtilisin family serine protease
MQRSPFRAAFAALVVLLVIVGFVGRRELRSFYHLRFDPRVAVAVLDTGVDSRVGAVSSHLMMRDGRGVALNVRDGGVDVQDTDGHGTSVALAVIQNCLDCLVIPVKISNIGAGVTPADLAAGVRFAVANGARVINISAGLTQGSPELEGALRDAASRGVVTVVAAGTGVANPFRPEPLEKIFPQSYPDVIVVGAAKSLAEPDPLMNFGSRLDVVVTDQPQIAYGSSLAAAAVSGIVARKLQREPGLNASRVRAMLRATARPPNEEKLPAGTIRKDLLSRLGAGAADEEAFLRY